MHAQSKYNVIRSGYFQGVKHVLHAELQHKDRLCSTAEICSVNTVEPISDLEHSAQIMS